MIVLLGLVVAASCAKNPFSTRETGDPFGSAGTWETPQTPDVAVKNLLFAFNEMIISNYELCFSDSFRFSAPEDSIDAVNNGQGDLFEDWSKQVEIGVANNIFSTFQSSDSLNVLLTMSPAGNYSDDIGDTSAVIYRDYMILMTATYPQGADTTLARGTATFRLYQEQLNWWTIYLWEDIPALPGQTDWGDIKADYRR